MRMSERMGGALKATVVTVAVVFLAFITIVVFREIISSRGMVRRQVLADGSLLILNRVAVGTNIDLVHGGILDKLLGGIIPSNGVHRLNLNLNRPIRQEIGYGGKSWLVAEFQLAGPGATNSALAKPAFYRQFRCVIYGEHGIPYVQEWWGRPEFKVYRDGCFGTIVTSRFPRDSRWLGFRIERRESSQTGGPWQPVADFKVQNAARPVIQTWTPDSGTKSAGGMEFSAGEVTVKTQPYSPRDIWNHVVTMPIQIQSNGVALTNWMASYAHVEDASGNWDMFASHRSLDPRFVWKLETDFEPASNFAEESLAKVTVPVSLPAPLVTNFAGVPITFSWVNNMVSAQIPTNRTDVAIKFLSAQDDTGAEIHAGNSSWGQFGFWEGMAIAPPVKGRYVQVNIAIVPNVHMTFYTQPRLLSPDAGIP